MIAGCVLIAVVAFLFFRSRDQEQSRQERATPAHASSDDNANASNTSRTTPAAHASDAHVNTSAEANERTPAARVELLRPPARANNTEAPVRIAEMRGLNDKRGAKSANSAAELEALNYGMETLDEDISECLEQWASSSSTISGRAQVGFRVDPKGLTTAWLEGGDQIPFGPRTCIANAVYGIDWSGIVDHPAEITRKFELGRDAGAD
jgi:hypothetical protein